MHVVLPERIFVLARFSSKCPDFSQTYYVSNGLWLSGKASKNWL